MAEKNSLWKNIRNKAKKNRASGDKPKQPTTEMLRQERKIKAKQYATGSFVGEDDKIVTHVKNVNDPAYKKYVIQKRLSDFSKLPYNHKDYLLDQDDFKTILTNDNSLANLPDSEWGKFLNPTFDEDHYMYNESLNDSTEGDYGSKIIYSDTTLLPTDVSYSTYDKINYPYDNPEFATAKYSYKPNSVDYDMPTFLKNHKPTKYHTRDSYGNVISTWYAQNDKGTKYIKPTTDEIENYTNLAELQKIYPKLTQEELNKIVNLKTDQPSYITNILDKDGDNDYDYYFNFPGRKNDVNYLASKGRYYPEEIQNEVNHYLSFIPEWDEPTDYVVVDPELEELKRKRITNIPIQEESLALTSKEQQSSYKMPEKKTVMFNQPNNPTWGVNPTDTGKEYNLGDKTGWHPYPQGEYTNKFNSGNKVIEEKYPSYLDYLKENSDEYNIQGEYATGGYFPTQGPGKGLFKGYARGGKDEEELPTYRYANKEGVIGGPRETSKGTALPVGPDGLPIVNMPEFEVISTGLNSQPNPYSPVTGEEYLSSGYNPINLFLPPQIEKQQQPIDPNTGMPLPQSGKADYDYGTEMGLAAPIAKGVSAAVKAIRTNPAIRNTVRSAINSADEFIGVPIQFRKQIKELKKLKEDYPKIFNTDEGKRRLGLLGIDPNKMSDYNLTFKPNLGSSYFTDGDDILNNINIDFRQLQQLKKEGQLLDHKSVFEHELGHLLQKEAYQQKGRIKDLDQFNLDTKKYLDDLAKHREFEERINNNPFLADWEKSFKILMDRPVKPTYPIITAKPTTHDKTLNGLFGDSDKISEEKLIEAFQTEHGDPSKLPFPEQSFSYFNYFTDLERFPHAREMRQNMLNSGVIKNMYDPITAEQLTKFIADNPKDRISSFILESPTNINKLKYTLNNMPSTAPVIGAGSAGALYQLQQNNQPQQQAKGGYTMKNNNKSWREYLQYATGGPYDDSLYDNTSFGGGDKHRKQVLSSPLNEGQAIGKPGMDWSTNWVSDPEFAKRFAENFPASNKVTDVQDFFTIKKNNEIRSDRDAANLSSSFNLVPSLVKDINDTQFLYNSNPTTNDELYNTYSSKYTDEDIKDVNKQLVKNPQAFTDPYGTAVIRNHANDPGQSGAESAAQHEIFHQIVVPTDKRDFAGNHIMEDIAKAYKGKFGMPHPSTWYTDDKGKPVVPSKEEFYPMLMQLRMDNKFQPGEIIDDARIDAVRKSGSTNPLLRHYNNELLKKYLNTFASNTGQPIAQQYAAKGGYTNPYNQYQKDPYLKYDGGGGYAWGTFNPNNPPAAPAVQNYAMDPGQTSGQPISTQNPNTNRQIPNLNPNANDKDSSLEQSVYNANVMGLPVGTALKVSDSISQGMQTGAQNMISKKFGLDQGEKDIMFAASNKTKNIPVFGAMAGQIGDMWNLASGKTKTYINDYHRDKRNQETAMHADLVNASVNAAHGGTISNNSLNLRNTMRNKRFAKGGTFDQFGINFIPESAGLHHESANGGVPIGPNALAEGGEAKLQMADGSQYIVSGEVDGANTQSINGETMTQRLKKKLKPFMMGGLASNPKDKENVRRPFDSYSEPAITQAANAAVQETEAVKMQRGGALQYAANGGKLTKDIEKIVMEEYTAAYGGTLPNKYKGKVNMPNSYAKGGIHIKESKKGTFTAAASKHGKSVQEFAKQVLANKENYSPAMVKKANFAHNAAGWKHADGGYVYNPMTQPMLAEGGPVYGDPASPYTYAYGGMYGDPYARGGQIDYTNDMYASGGPMVGNAPQQFKGPAAQNRGGMLMNYADGGMIPPEQQMMQEQMMQQQAPQEQMQQQGGQEQMMQMVQQIAQAIMQGENPEQIMQQLVSSGMPAEQAQQVIQAAMQIANQQQQQQPMQQEQQMMPEQGMMSNGGKLPREILRARAEAHMSPEKAASYVNNYSRGGKKPPYIDEYGNLIGDNAINLREKTEPITTLNRIESNYFDTSNSYNPNPYLVDNQLKSFPRLTNWDTPIERNQGPWQPGISRPPLKSFDPNEYSGDETTMPDGTTFDGNVYNTQTPTDHYYSNQDVLTGFSNRYPGNTNDTNNVNQNKDTPWFEEPWWSKASRYGQAGPGFLAAGIAARNRKYLTADQVTPPQVSLLTQRITDAENSRNALNAGLKAQRDSAANAGMLAGNTTELVTRANKGLAERTNLSTMEEEKINAGLRGQYDLNNVAARNQFKLQNRAFDENRKTQMVAGLQDSTSKLASTAQEERKQNLQEWIAQNRLGTRSYRTNINGQDVYISPDNKIYDAKTGTLLSV